MLTTFINTLMSAEADAVCGAEYGTRSAQRTNTGNGYRAGSWTPAPARWTWSAAAGRSGR